MSRGVQDAHRHCALHGSPGYINIIIYNMSDSENLNSTGPTVVGAAGALSLDSEKREGIADDVRVLFLLLHYLFRICASGY